MHDLLLTPFERNLEVWRQLWRVLERSHLIVQIVDARNPENFRSSDLEDYVRSLDAEGKIVDKGSDEGNKRKALLLINKSDLLTLDQRCVAPRLASAMFDADELARLLAAGGNGPTTLTRSAFATPSSRLSTLRRCKKLQRWPSSRRFWPRRLRSRTSLARTKMIRARRSWKSFLSRGVTKSRRRSRRRRLISSGTSSASRRATRSVRAC